VKNCSLWEDPTLEKVVENCLSWERPHAGAGEECEESFPVRRKVQHRHCVMNWLHPPFQIPLHRSGGWWGRKTGVQLRPGRRRGGGRSFKIYCYFSLFFSDFIGDKLNFFFSPSSVCFVRVRNRWMISPCPYSNPRASSQISSPLSSWGGRVRELLSWAPGISPG